MSALALINSVLGGGAVSVLTKVTAILLLALCAALGMRRRSAASRHLVWLAALSACAVLAVLAPLVPRIPLPVPVQTQVPRLPSLAAADNGSSRRSGSASVAASSTSEPSSLVGVANAGPTAAAAASEMPDRGKMAAILWLLGCVIVGGRYVGAHQALARLIRRARAEHSSSWDAQLTAAGRDAGLGRGVQLFVSDDLSAPVTFGSFRPVVVLPADADGWSNERRHIVLVHELAHVARFDALAQVVANLTCALFWFHPLAWFSASRMRAEAELAADDRVLSAGTPGVTYATHLLELARVRPASGWSPSVVVGMARSSNLESRFRAMLDDRRSHAPVSLRRQVGAIGLASAIMVPIAGLRTVASAAPVASQPLSIASPNSAPRSVDARDTQPARLADMVAPAVPTVPKLASEPTPEPAQAVAPVTAQAVATVPVTLDTGDIERRDTGYVFHIVNQRLDTMLVELAAVVHMKAVLDNPLTQRVTLHSGIPMNENGIRATINMEAQSYGLTLTYDTSATGDVSVRIRGVDRGTGRPPVAKPVMHPEDVQTTDKGFSYSFAGRDLSVALNELATAMKIGLFNHPGVPPQTITYSEPAPVPEESILEAYERLSNSYGLAAFFTVIPGQHPARLGSVNAVGNSATRIFMICVEPIASVGGAVRNGCGNGQSGVGMPDGREFTTKGTSWQSYQLTRAHAAALAPELARILIGADSTSRVALAAQTARGGDVLSALVVIGPDQAANALLVRATPSDWTIIQRIIQAVEAASVPH